MWSSGPAVSASALATATLVKAWKHGHCGWPLPWAPAPGPLASSWLNVDAAGARSLQLVPALTGLGLRPRSLNIPDRYV